MSGKVVAVPFVLAGLALVGWLVWQEAFPESYVTTFDLPGKLTHVEATGDGRLVLLEEVSRRSRKGASFSVTRMRVLDGASGKVVGGPWVSPKARWLGVVREIAVSQSDESGVEGRSLKTGEVVLTKAKLEALAPGLVDIQLRRDGRLAITTDQARVVVIDPTGPAVVDAAELPPQPAEKLRNRPDWQGLGGHHRMTLTGAEPALLLASWLQESGTLRALPSGTGWLAQHTDKIGNGSGVLISSVDEKGVEAWRHDAGPQQLKWIFRVGTDAVVLGLVDSSETWTIQALELASGKVRWTLSAPPP